MTKFQNCIRMCIRVFENPKEEKNLKQIKKELIKVAEPFSYYRIDNYLIVITDEVKIIPPSAFKEPSEDTLIQIRKCIEILKDEKLKGKERLKCFIENKKKLTELGWYVVDGYTIEVGNIVNFIPESWIKNA